MLENFDFRRPRAIFRRNESPSDFPPRIARFCRSFLSQERDAKMPICRLLVLHSDLSTPRRANIAPRFLISYHKQPYNRAARADSFVRSFAGWLARSFSSADDSEKLPRRFAIMLPSCLRRALIIDRGSDRLSRASPPTRALALGLNEPKKFRTSVALYLRLRGKKNTRRLENSREIGTRWLP